MIVMLSTIVNPFKITGVNPLLARGNWMLEMQKIIEKRAQQSIVNPLIST